MGLRVVDDKGASFTSPSNQPRLCSQIVSSFHYKENICGNCLPTFLGGKQVVNRNLDFVCLPGLHNYVVPLSIESGKVIGYLIVGPVFLVTRQPKEEYRKLAEEIKVELEELWDVLVEIKILSFQGAQSLVELIRDVTEFVLKCSHHNLSQSVPKVSQNLQAGNRMFQVLLDVAFQVSGADVGSIMFFEKGNDYLKIQYSKGLPDDVSQSTRVKAEESISGIVAKENRSILLDDTLTEQRIKSRLNRPQLKSAMSLPIRAQNRVVGVMNLGVLRTSPLSFDRNNLQLMAKLIDLATVAIYP